jgi:penicillin-binding protein 2
MALPRYDEQSLRNTRSAVLIGLTALLAGILVLRFFYIQGIKGDYYDKISQENMARLEIVRAQRGPIYDRNGRVLARNRPSYSIAMVYADVRDKKDIRAKLLRIKNPGGGPLFDSAFIAQQLRRGRGRPFEPLVLLDDVDFRTVTFFEEHSSELPGINVRADTRREYPLRTLAAHALGYISEIPEEDFDGMKEQGYQYGDLVGKFGLEKQYEPYFRGRHGKRYIQYNAWGQPLGKIPGLPEVPPRNGDSVYLTLDLDLQREAEAAFPDSQKGGLVVLDPRNGEVLAMVSSPRFDPNVFTKSSLELKKGWQKLVLDPDLPLNNRAIAGLYPPGSTFKLITAVGGLLTKQIDPEERPRFCSGGMRYGSRYYECWKPRGHGKLKLVEAITQSCDVYFYTMGIRLDEGPINEAAALYGLGSRTGVDLPGEKSGELLGEAGYNKKFGSRGWRWSKGMLLNLAIGQGQTVTPIQLACQAAGLGSGQAIYQPHLLLRIKKCNGGDSVPGRVVTHQLNIPGNVESLLREALADVVNLPTGTAGQARVPGVIVGGKTGSSQNLPGEKTDALFYAMAPIDSPVIAVAVVLENAGHGGSVAAPIAGKILRAYFKGKTDAPVPGI